jgi:hypothetical protein
VTGRIRSIEQSKGLIGNRNRELPACSIVFYLSLYDRHMARPIDACIQTNGGHFSMFCECFMFSDIYNAFYFLKSTLFWDGTPCDCIEVHRRFGGTASILRIEA